MANWKGQSKGTPAGYKFFIVIIKNLGLRPAYLLLYPVVTYYYFFSKASNNAIKQYFNNLTQFHTSHIKTSRFKLYLNMGKVLIDKIALLSNSTSPPKVIHQGGDNLQNLVKNNSGGFLISAHIGNWEVAGSLLKRLDAKINIVLLDGETEAIKKVMNKAIGSRSFNIIPMKSDMSHVFKIHQAAQNKELICIHGDRFLPGSKTIEASFLNKKASFPLGPFSMAAKLELPVAFVYGLKQETGFYNFYCSTPLVGQNSADTIFASYLASLQTMVSKYPHQWYNFYPFWS